MSYVMADGTLVVGTPKNPQEGKAGGLDCKYPDMTDWDLCFELENRTCWLKKKDNSTYIDIMTDYENPWEVPNGTTRRARGIKDGLEVAIVLTMLTVLPRGL